jgi:hypothetical protein
MPVPNKNIRYRSVASQDRIGIEGKSDAVIQVDIAEQFKRRAGAVLPAVDDTADKPSSVSLLMVYVVPLTIVAPLVCGTVVVG